MNGRVTESGDTLSIGDMVIVVDRSLGCDPKSELIYRATGEITTADNYWCTVRITRQIGNTGYEPGEEYSLVARYLVRLDPLTALAMECE